MMLSQAEVDGALATFAYGWLVLPAVGTWPASLGSALAKYGVRDQGRISVKGEERVRFLFSAAIPDE
jgi:hypothetical protein